MKLIGGITRFLYTMILIVLGGCLILIAFHLIPKEKLLETINIIYITPNLRLATGFTGLLLIALSLLVIQVALGKLEREKTIAFENPDGQVTVALTAIEDLMKRMGRQIPEIKELKPKVVSSKKGLILDTPASDLKTLTKPLHQRLQRLDTSITRLCQIKLRRPGALTNKFQELAFPFTFRQCRTYLDTRFDFIVRDALKPLGLTSFL